MKTRIARTLTTAIALVAAVAVHAQTTKTLKADVPFSFYAGNTHMAPGAYRLDQAANGVALWLSSPHSSACKSVGMTRIIGKDPSESALLVFHRYGTEYFLSEVWAGGGAAGHAVIRTSREKELAESHSAGTLSVIRVALYR